MIQPASTLPTDLTKSGRCVTSGPRIAPFLTAWVVMFLVGFAQPESAETRTPWSETAQSEIRSECLVRLQSLAKKLRREERKPTDLPFFLSRYASRKGVRIADFDIAGGLAKSFYLHFVDHCDRRFEFAEEMAEALNASHGNTASITVSRQPIQISGIVTKLIFLPGVPKFTREQCTVRLETTQPGPTHRRDLRGKMLDNFLAYGKKKYPETALFGFYCDNHRNCYLHYYSRCDRKFEMARTMVKAYSRKFPDALRVEVKEDPVRLCDLGSQFFGFNWIDGNKYCAPKRGRGKRVK